MLTPLFIDQPLPEARRLASPHWKLNAPELPDGNVEARLAAKHEPLIDLVHEAVRQNRCPVSVAGDCCATIAVLAGLQRGGVDPFLVWLDAHGDFNTRETSPSGFLGGMPLAMIVGRGDQTVVRAAGLRTLRESDVLLADARNLDPGEREALEGSAVRRVSDMARLVELLPPGRLVYVHFDCDIINPAEAPAVGWPAPGGPSLADVCALASALAATNRLAAISLTLWVFAKDADQRTERAVLKAFRALTGQSD